MNSAINCGACGTENPSGARFCMSCGAALARSCPSCGTEAPAQARFCPACGSALDQTAAPSPGEAAALGTATPPDEAAPSEERRTVTVLFADLSGYTSVAERLDHETVKALTDRC